MYKKRSKKSYNKDFAKYATKTKSANKIGKTASFGGIRK